MRAFAFVAESARTTVGHLAARALGRGQDLSRRGADSKDTALAPPCDAALSQRAAEIVRALSRRADDRRRSRGLPSLHAASVSRQDRNAPSFALDRGPHVHERSQGAEVEILVAHFAPECERLVEVVVVGAPSELLHGLVRRAVHAHVSVVPRKEGRTSFSVGTLARSIFSRAPSTVQ